MTIFKNSYANDRSTTEADTAAAIAKKVEPTTFVAAPTGKFYNKA